MERCARCNVGEDKVQLYDALYEGEIALLCERCSIIENIPLLKKPSEFQLKKSERGVGVYERMRKIAGVKEEKKEDKFLISEKLNEIEKNPSLELPVEKSLNLIEHFHWEIMNNRRRKGLSQKQLAEMLGVSEISLEMLEKGIVPRDSEIIIRRLEQFFRIKLRKINETEELLKKQEKKPILLDEYGKPLELIPEPGSEVLEGEDSKDIENIDFDREDFDFSQIDTRRVRVSDLIKLHRKKAEVTKQEKVNKQSKIEERQKLVEARKEELREKKEKESSEIDNLLGGSELLKKEN